MMTFESDNELEIGAELPPLPGMRPDKFLFIARLERVTESGHYLYEVSIADRAETDTTEAERDSD